MQTQNLFNPNSRYIAHHVLGSINDYSININTIQSHTKRISFLHSHDNQTLVLLCIYAISMLCVLFISNYFIILAILSIVLLGNIDYYSRNKIELFEDSFNLNNKIIKFNTILNMELDSQNNVLIHYNNIFTISNKKIAFEDIENAELLIDTFNSYMND